MNIAVIKLLQNTYKKLQDEPVEGFTVVPNENDFLDWAVYIEGPKDTPYEGGIFELRMTFPDQFPMMPPTLEFVSEFFHPNVYANGKVCISILHEPGTDAFNELESASERWLPSQTVSSIIMSVISMLNDPNFSSPANIDASVLWRNDFEKYKEKCATLVRKANEANSDVFIPHPETNPEERQIYLAKQRSKEGGVIGYDDYEVDWGDSADFGSFSENSDEFSLSDISFDDSSKDKEEKEEIEEKQDIGDQEKEKITNGETAELKLPGTEDRNQEKEILASEVLKNPLSGSKRKHLDVSEGSSPKRQRVE
eukprot:TRINITY_DN6213_c0_g1_i1.p1 TRINITY_DN6213_c0_g1~~TRINITY_DN6213_c0_g1_i1.p1  ORF type:complete len:310 (+),score=96.29 TRINITY_DN6213_c0_g1_i1:20-949(+)